MHWKQLPWPYCSLAYPSPPRVWKLVGLRVLQARARSRGEEVVTHLLSSCWGVVDRYLDSGHTDTPWAGEQVHKHSLEVVRKDKDHLEVVEEEERSLPAQVHTLQEQVHSHLEQVGQGHTLQVQVCIHSQGAGEELHWKH